MKKYIGIFVCVVFLAAAVIYARRHWGDFSALMNISPSGLAAMIGLNVLTRVFVGARLKYLTAPFGVNITLAEGTELSFAQSYGNVVAIKGGTAGVAYYLYARKGFSIDRFLVITGGGFVVTVLVVSLAGLAGVGVTSLSSSVGPEIPLFFSTLLIGALALIVFPRFKLPKFRFSGFIDRMVEGWEMLRKGGNIARLAAAELGILFTFALRYYAAFRCFSIAITLPQSFLLAPPAYLSLMVNVTPAGMGVREAALAYMSDIMGYAIKGGLGATALDSMVMVGISLLVGPIAAYRLMPRGEKKNALP